MCEARGARESEYGLRLSPFSMGLGVLFRNHISGVFNPLITHFIKKKKKIIKFVLGNKKVSKNDVCKRNNHSPKKLVIFFSSFKHVYCVTCVTPE